MLRLKITCLDIILFSAIAYSASDLIKNWGSYNQCDKPMHIWLLISNLTLLSFRILHFVGQVMSGEVEPEVNQQNGNQQAPAQTQFNWEKMSSLIKLSYILLVLVYPFFTTWTIIGTAWFVKSNYTTPECLEDLEQYSFMIFWIILCYILVFCYGILIIVWICANQNSIKMRKNIISLLRRMNIHELDNELYDNARQNVQEETQRRHDTIKTLNEYGLYFMQRGLNQQEFQKIKIVAYKSLYGDQGFTRCSVCLNDFLTNEKLKQFPKCEHLYHIKCLDLWLSIEPNCPNCLRTYLQNSFSQNPNESGGSEGQIRGANRVHQNLINDNNLLNIPGRVDQNQNNGLLPLNSPRPRPGNVVGLQNLQEPLLNP